VRFWDASAIVPLLVEQSASPAVLRASREDPAAVVWWATRIECLSALTRLEREHRISHEGFNLSTDRLTAILAACHEVQPGARLRQVAERLLRVHPLRASDALQLAAALMAAGDDPGSLPLVSLDRVLNAAAEREGLPVVVPA
jgi:predicted nucleic acid-binding protein